MKKFTLMELLIVVAVIAILLSLLLPSLSKARDRAKTAVCLSNQKQITVAIQMYSSRYDNTLPRAGNSWANILGSKGYLNAPRVDKFDGSNLDVEVTTSFNPFHCPSGLTDKLSFHTKSNKWWWESYEDTHRPWRSGDSESEYSQTEFPAGYDVWYGVVGRAARTNNNWTNPIWRTVSDGSGWPKMLLIENTSSAAAFHDGTHHMHTFLGDQSRISARHNGNNFTNTAFYDGHAKTFLRSSVVAGATLNGTSDHPVIFKSVKN